MLNSSSFVLRNIISVCSWFSQLEKKMYLQYYLFAFILKIKSGFCPIWSCWPAHLKDILSSIMPHLLTLLDLHVCCSLSLKQKFHPSSVFICKVTCCLPRDISDHAIYRRPWVYSPHTHCSQPLSFPELFLICTCMPILLHISSLSLPTVYELQERKD